MSRDYPSSKRLEAINNSYSIMHYGVKGMKWGKKKRSADSALDSARKAKLEAQTMRSIIDRDTTYTIEGNPQL